MAHPGHAERLALHSDMVAMTEAMIAEFADRLPAASVSRCISRCREDLLRAGLRAGLVEATAAAARRQLDAHVPAHAEA
jgi:hypothetical protein